MGMPSAAKPALANMSQGARIAIVGVGVAGLMAAYTLSCHRVPPRAGDFSTGGA